MASSTTNLDLTLPVGGEHVSRQIINANNVKIDEAVGPVPSGTNLQSQVNALNNNLSGLLSSASKSTETDFNNCKSPGTYKGGTGTTSNMPANGYFVMTVFQFSNNDLAQVAIEVNNGRMFKRTFHDNTTWTSWQELALESDNPGFPVVTQDFSARVITTYNQSYTATENCWFKVWCKATGSSDNVIYIDSKELSHLTANSNEIFTAVFPVKAGTVISSRNNSSSGEYIVYRYAKG